MSKITIHLDTFDTTETFAREFSDEAIMADDFMQFCVDAYVAFTYQNSVTVKFPDSDFLETLKYKNKL